MAWKLFFIVGLVTVITEPSIRLVFANRRGYIVTAPRIMQSDSQEKVCFMSHGLDFDVRVNLTMWNKELKERSIHQHIFDKGKSECITIRTLWSEAQAELMVEGWGVDQNEENFYLNASAQVIINRGKLITFIQTDKPIYKPGQTVKLRILSLKPDLRPRLDGETLVWIENPNGVRLQQWIKPDMEDGIIDLEFPLSEEPVQGKWMIFAEIENEKEGQEFEVKEYVLPKFEVFIRPPPFIMVDDKEVKVEICAKYSYGQPVKGKLRAQISISDPYGYSSPSRPCFRTTEMQINGCKTVTVNSSAVMLDSLEWSVWRARLKVVAAVTEAATGTVIEATDDSGKVERTPLKFELDSHMPHYYKPGLTFYGKVVVKKPDGRAAAKELIRVEATNVKYNMKWGKNFTTDEYGVVKFHLPPQKAGLGMLSIEVKAPEYLYLPHQHTFHQKRYVPYEPTTSHYLKQWYSPSGHFLQIDPKDDVLKCGQKHNITVRVTTSGHPHTLIYQVLSRGNILTSGRIALTGQRLQAESGEDHPAMLTPLSSEIRREESSSEPVVNLPEYVEQMEIPVLIQSEMSPSASVLVYHVMENGEVIADSHEFMVEKCMENKVGMKFSSDQRYPGEDVTLELSAKPGSLCAVGSVDKSIHFLSTNNQISMDKVFKALEQYNIPSQHYNFYMDAYCQEKMKQRPPPPIGARPPGRPGPAGFDPEPAPFRRKRSFMPFPGVYSKYVDSIKAFRNAGFVTLTDLDLETRPCEMDEFVRGRLVYYSMSGAVPGPVGPEQPVTIYGQQENLEHVEGEEDAKPHAQAVDIRNYFPETWLWSLEKIGVDGKKKLTKSLPHTITDWVSGAFCSHPQAGLGVAPSATVRGFQPFFASFSLPYSVVRGERVSVVVTVFNYLSENLGIKLVLKKSDFYRIDHVDNSAERTWRRLCVHGGQSASATFRIAATKLGEIDLTVKVVSIMDEELCNTNAVVSSHLGVRDAVTRKLRVQAEGKPEEYAFSSFACPKGDDSLTENITLKLPANIVSDSARASFSVMGDVMGSSLSGLENLVQYPSGCGEQNMVRFAPIISVMQYLTETAQLTNDMQKKAIGYLHAGYQRELTYRHRDGSYSAFGERDDEGSIWLTAFVVKSFAQAHKFIYIDSKDLQKSLGWFKSVQLENGCFRQIGSVHNKALKGGLGRDGSSLAGLTAYILMAMMESGVNKKDESIINAVECLRIQTVDDVYTTTLLAYTLNLYDRTHPAAVEYMRKMQSLAITSAGTLHWGKTREAAKPTSPAPYLLYHQASSAEVEMTAYALMAYMIQGLDRSATIAAALPIVQWLTKQRNAYGGFASTQDTVVALEALSKFASLAYGKRVDITVRALGRNFEKTMKVNSENSLVLQKTSLKTLPNELTIETRGTGCAFIQASVKYNVKKTNNPHPVFNLKVSVHRVKTGTKFCRRRKLSICTRYTGEDDVSNMAIVTVKMVSGWIPEKDSVKKLLNDAKLNLKRYEIEKDSIHLYFQELTKQVKCLQVGVFQDITVSNVKAALVEVYDYYDTDLPHVSFPYSIKQTCGTKEEIPYQPPDTTDDDFIAQVRVDYPPFGKAPPVTHCPECLDSRPDSLVSDFCQSKHALKMYLRGHPRIPLKALSDIRPTKMKRLNLYVRYQMPSQCQCQLLARKSRTKLLFLLKSTALQPHQTKKKEATLELSDDVKVLLLDRRMQRDLQRIARKGKCDAN